MIYLSNQNIAQLLTSKDCIEALDEAFHALARGEAVSRPRTDVWVPCGGMMATTDGAAWKAPSNPGASSARA